MGSIFQLAATALALAMSSGTESAGDGNRETNDLVVLGRVGKGLDYEALDEWGMNAQITARLRIKRVVKGHIPASVIKIRYIAHSDMPKNQELRLRLRRSDEGVYLVCSEGGRPGYVCD